MGKIIGIDLGSTNSAVAIIEGGKATAIANSEGNRTTPSIIALKNGEIKVGDAAKRQMVVNPKETVNIIKRFMGETYESASKAIKHVQYEVVNDNGKPCVNVEGRHYTPEELSAMILTKMKKTAEDYVGEEIKDAVITVPAYFSDAARQATKTAGEIAGLTVHRVIAEPTAAILAANLDMKKEARYLVVDIGGATTDFSVAEIADDTVEINGVDGDTYLGGTDFDKALADYVVETFKKENSIDLSKDVQALARIIEASEKAKIELSSSMSTSINLPYITAVDGTPMHLNMDITRSKFEQLITPFVNKALEKAKSAISKANVTNDDLDGIVLVGGSCRIPLIKERLSKEISTKIVESANLDLAVAEGAATQGGIINGETNSDLLLIDVIPLPYGIETLGGIMTPIIEANSNIPCKMSKVFSTAADNQTAITVRVLQGERPMANDNKEIALFNLDGILPARRGVPQLEVTFDIDANGILSVSAKDKGTGNEQHITIQSSGSLSQEEIDRMKAEAEKYADEDKKKKEEAETINKGDSIVFSQEKLLEEIGDKITEDEKNQVKELVEKMKTAVSEKNVDDINKIEKEINDLWNGLSQKLYSQQATTSENNSSEKASENENSEKSDENVQDADYEEVN